MKNEQTPSVGLGIQFKPKKTASKQSPKAFWIWLIVAFLFFGGAVTLGIFSLINGSYVASALHNSSSEEYLRAVTGGFLAFFIPFLICALISIIGMIMLTKKGSPKKAFIVWLTSTLIFLAGAITLSVFVFINMSDIKSSKDMYSQDVDAKEKIEKLDENASFKAFVAACKNENIEDFNDLEPYWEACLADSEFYSCLETATPYYYNYYYNYNYYSWEWLRTKAEDRGFYSRSYDPYSDYPYGINHENADVFTASILREIKSGNNERIENSKDGIYYSIENVAIFLIPTLICLIACVISCFMTLTLRKKIKPEGSAKKTAAQERAEKIRAELESYKIPSDETVNASDKPINPSKSNALKNTISKVNDWQYEGGFLGILYKVIMFPVNLVIRTLSIPGDCAALKKADGLAQKLADDYNAEKAEGYVNIERRKAKEAYAKLTSREEKTAFFYRRFLKIKDCTKPMLYAEIMTYISENSELFDADLPMCIAYNLVSDVDSTVCQLIGVSRKKIGADKKYEYLLGDAFKKENSDLYEILSLMIAANAKEGNIPVSPYDYDIMAQENEEGDMFTL